MKKFYKRLLISLVLGLIGMLFSLPVLAAVGDITIFTGKPTDTTVVLSWTKITTANSVLIRYSTTTYPTTTGGVDGTTIYLSTGNKFTHTGLTAGTNYYYSIWEFDGTIYSTNECNLLKTTTAAITTGLVLPTPTMNMNPSAPSSTGWFNSLQPFSGFVRDFAASWGIPGVNIGVILGVFLMLIVGIGLYIKTKSPLIAVGADLAVNGLLIILTLMPIYSIAITLAFGLGIWALESYSI
jgi:hypothetical protein